MLTDHRRPVCLSLISTDLPILSTLETAATIYPKAQQSFHLLLHQPEKMCFDRHRQVINEPYPLTWLEMTPYRVVMTQQSPNQLSYRHFWEKGVYGMSRYWLNDNGDDRKDELGQHFPQEIQVRNFTRNLKLVGDVLPEYLRVEYELWTGKMQLGHYVLHLEIYP